MRYVLLSFIGLGLLGVTLKGFATTDAQPTPSIPALASQTPQANDLTIDTSYDKKTGTFTTKGRLESRVDTGLLAEIVDAVDEYDLWAVKDINKDYKERGLLVMIRKLSFSGPKKELTTVFDLNLPWPFNFKDMTMPLYEVKKEYNSEEQLKFMRYGMRKPSLTLNQFDVDFKLGNENDQGTIDFEFKVRIAALLDAFVSRERYVKNVQGRIAQLMINLRNHAQEMLTEDPSP